MQNLVRVSRINVLTAIRDYDLQGAGPFLAALGFDAPSDEVLVERGKRYDARAVLAYAYGKATGEVLPPEQIVTDSLKVLADLEFTVAWRSEFDRPRTTPPTRARASTPRASRAATPTARSKPEPIVRLCPSCFTQLSMTGTCDYCE